MFDSRVVIERDPNNKNLEEQLLSTLSSIIKQNEPPSVKQPTADVKTISMEDAIKELLTLETK